MSSLLIKGGTIVDGTGAPRFQGDVLIADGKISKVGKPRSRTPQVIDATGLIVAPGIIDPHTHVDAQLLWEPRGTSSSWNGVTTVMTGLCGYSMGPCRREDRDYILRMFCGVEEMPLEVLKAGVSWSWTTFPEYMKSLDRGLGVNVAPLVGHSSIRYYVMGAGALERPANPEEIGKMCAALRESLEAGAFGFSTSRSPTHADSDGQPVPSRQAAPQELIALAGELRGLAATGMALVPSAVLAGMTEADQDLVLQMSLASGRPLQLNAIGGRDLEFMAEAGTKGAFLWAVENAQPRYRIWTLREGTGTFNSMPAWRDVMQKPESERVGLLASREMRETLRRDVDSQAMAAASRGGRGVRWEALRVERAHREQNRALEGLSIDKLAPGQGKHPADALLDLAIAEDFRTEFRYQIELDADHFVESKAARLRNPQVVPMNTDAGAHLSHECRTGEGTYFLRNWVLDRGHATLEEGVRKVTSLPAHYMGLTDRGVIAEGAAADLILFDAAEVACLAKERAYDFPGGAKRWVQKSRGIQYVMVNGHPTIWQGKETGDLPGRVLRGTSYR